MNVYLIRQQHTHLFGDVLDSAVVVADSIPSAQKTVLNYLKEKEIVWDSSLWAITRLGNNAKRPPEPFDSVVCINVLNKAALPPGNYRMSKR